MDQRRVRTSRLPPLSTRENPCLGAGGCRGGFVGGALFRVSRYVSIREHTGLANSCAKSREKCAIA